MFTKGEIKVFLIRLGEKWFFPDFTNKLTWYIVTLGASFILIPQPVKLFITNWLIETFNLNSGLKLTLPEMESSSDYTVGLILIFFSLAHNLGYKYFGLKKEQFEHKACQKKRISDYKLLERFTAEFPSDSPSCYLLKDHDFGGSFNNDGLVQINHFYYKWNGAEYKFLDNVIEKKRTEFHEECGIFLSKISEYTTPVGASNFTSVIPDRFRANDWDLPEWIKPQIEEMNALATNIYKHHQEFIWFARNKLQS